MSTFILTIRSYKKHVGTRNSLPKLSKPKQNSYCNLESKNVKFLLSSTFLPQVYFIQCIELMYYINDQHYYVNRAYQNNVCNV